MLLTNDIVSLNNWALVTGWQYKSFCLAFGLILLCDNTQAGQIQHSMACFYYMQFMVGFNGKDGIE